MTEEKSDIFLAGGDAHVYLTGLMHNKYSTPFARGHPFSAHVSYDKYFNPLSLIHICTHLE